MVDMQNTSYTWTGFRDSFTFTSLFANQAVVTVVSKFVITANYCYFVLIRFILSIMYNV